MLNLCFVSVLVTRVYCFSSRLLLQQVKQILLFNGHVMAN